MSLSLDDFGTGYSSLSYLHRFPLQKLKIDKSFIEEIPGERTMQIVRAVAQLAETLKLEVIAEGVEAESSVDLLNGVHCGSAQGYYYCPPVDESTLDSLMLHTGVDSGVGAEHNWTLKLPVRA